MKTCFGHWRRFHSGSVPAHPIICKRVTCPPTSSWLFSNKARTRHLLHSSTLYQHIPCTYQNPLPLRARRTGINVSLEHPLPRCSNHTSKDIRARMFPCIQPDNHNRTSMVNRLRYTSPPTAISNMFLTSLLGGLMVQLRSWACNLARVLFRRARTTSNKMCAFFTHITHENVNRAPTARWTTPRVTTEAPLQCVQFICHTQASPPRVSVEA